MRWAPALAGATMLVCATTLAAQGRAPVRAEGMARPQRPPASDSAGAGRDSTGARRTLMTWTPDDSVMLALLQRAGYRVVRYESDTVGFDAGTRTMSLAAGDSGKSAVQRDATLLVATQITYNDSTELLAARGDTIVMRDPDRGEDIIGQVEMTYDISRREGRTRDFSTVANSGADWRVMAHRAAFSSDSTSDRSTVYGRDGIITSCMDSVPHYHFLAKELKRVSNSVIIARPAIFYVDNVPVMWLPFIFQDIRSGRRSGLLTPRVGFSELVRNSPTYRRTIDDLGYYFALSDYYDAQVSMSWRSQARATTQDPGWVRVRGQIRYRWLDRFLGGSVAVSRDALSNGNRNIALAWSHAQEFSSRTRFSTNINYSTNTSVQRQTAINPVAALATIASQANFVRQQGPFAVNVGGSRRQYLGRDQVDQAFPSLNVASRPLTIGDWFVVTPSLAMSNAQRLGLDGAGDFLWRYTAGPGGLDSTRRTRNERTSGLTLSTPFKFFGFQVNTDVRYNDVAADYPSIKTVPDPDNPTQFIERVYAQTYLTTMDYSLGIGLPQFLQGTWNVAPGISFSNVHPRGSFVRSERTNGAWVSQSKRLSYGVGVSPTFFKLLPGLGPIERMRHAVSPTLSWSYSPTAKVNDAFLLAHGDNPTIFTGGLAQNRVSLSLSTSLEARMRSPADSGGAEGPKIRIVSLQFSGLTYDFQKKKEIGGTGIVTDRAGYTFRSDLLPGFDLGVDYSLFQGSVYTDTAVFAPYREAVRFGFSLNQRSALVRGVARLLGGGSSAGAPAGAGTGDGAPAESDNVMGGGLVSSMDPTQQGMGSASGTRGYGAVQELNTSGGFTATFSVSQSRQRPPAGNGRVIESNPEVECAALLGLPQYDYCVAAANRDQPRDGGDTGTSGSTFVRLRPTTSIGIRTSFNLTPRWAAGWNTTYDAERREFAAQVVTLQRDMHDWKAIFGFTKAPNGNFAFTFFISLKAQPEIKFDYDRQTYRQPTQVP